MALFFWKLLLPLAVAGTSATLVALCLERTSLPAASKMTLWKVAALFYLLPLPVFRLRLPPRAPALPAASPTAGGMGGAVLPAPVTPSSPTVANATAFWEQLAVVVLAVGLVVLAVRVAAWGKLALGLRARCRREADPAILALWADCLAKQNPGRQVRLLRCAGIDTPVAWGLFRPAVLLPEDNLPPQELELALLHELTHLGGGDLLWKRLAWLVSIVHWWNPLAYRLARQMDRAAEQRCDAALAADMTAGQRQEYAQLLLATAGRQGLPGAAALGSGGLQLKERLEQILQVQKATPPQRLLGIGAAAALVAVALVCTGAARPPLGQKGTGTGVAGGLAPVDGVGPLALCYPVEQGYVAVPIWGYWNHTGTDYAAALDTDVYATASGTVVKSMNDGAYGNHVMIDHGGGYITLYGQLNRRDVEVGDMVEQGAVIGGVGHTGNAYGNHLHLELRYNGQYLDPERYITEDPPSAADKRSPESPADTPPPLQS